MSLFQAVLFMTMLANVLGSINVPVKCLVCKQVVETISSSIRSEDPKKMVQIGSFRIEPDGSQKKTQVRYAGSELHLHEILENVCDSFSDYAQAKHKETGELALLNLSKDVEKLSTYELVQDPDLNRNLKYYCESFVEDFEDGIVSEFQKTSKEDSDSKIHLCQTVAGYCVMGPNFHHEL